MVDIKRWIISLQDKKKGDIAQIALSPCKANHMRKINATEIEIHLK